MTVNIKLSNTKEITVKNISLRKLRALKTIHGESNISLVLNTNLSTLNW